MKFSLIKILSFSALLAYAVAAPLKDVSVTSIDLAENTYNKKGDEHLYVTVTRVDDLLDDDGSLLAERVMAVQVTFDVVENQLMCNGRPVDIGVSNIQVEAQMASNPAKLIIASEEDAALLADSFDVGLVTVQVTANLLEEIKTEDGLVLRRIGVQELITEVNGQKVVQTEAGQQILDVYDNGSLVKWAVDPLTGFMLPGPAMMENDSNDVMNVLECPGCESFDFEKWWDESSNFVQAFTCGFFVTFFAGLLFALHRLFASRPSGEYEAVAVVVEEPPAYAEKEQKQPLMEKQQAEQ
ncbi:uncharacterized protein B0P05DRAFT_573142 [Gilbertella persicaria]|uniref:uncharacterized protein n=1 Tax=Gilbertella persicaria TaxID=101096 RepID=UPI00221F1389|nr:uncharacterized protein B0P05DRAFT_573142 [Gilbertella persicaria]KAI8072221.1 hypothetical protein B0P05DRAFT_573142 [Gilbertella persicaria]